MHSGLSLTLLSVAILTVPIPAQPVPETFTLTVPDGLISSQSGSSVSLLCQVSPIFNIKPFEVQWYRSDDVNKPTLLYMDHKIQEALMDPRFRGRVSLTGGLERGNASLRLERVTLEDSGEFVCYIASNKWYEKAHVVLAVSGDSKGFTVTQVLLVVLPVFLVIIICALCFIVFKRKGFKCSSLHTSRKHTDQNELGQNLAGAENTVQMSTKQTASDEEDNLKDWLLGKRFRAEHITMDKETASTAISVTHHGKRVNYIKAKDTVDHQSYHVLGNKGFDSGQHYWKVKVNEYANKEKLAWYLGVTRENAKCPLT
ncbi:myelin-oligodendrocyte glycoprotein-like isoform X1 [Esox lucius]|uniref:myelin-oligodendrocyte glycoprotein-like isoform X1 n=1 Tax=Esox lucius TaxID=8010 RepID=UPI0014771586|nr:myelin-oligodendrocyte glycoprotein-like isoform X1 [Esox lucius]